MLQTTCFKTGKNSQCFTRKTIEQHFVSSLGGEVGPGVLAGFWAKSKWSKAAKTAMTFYLGGIRMHIMIFESSNSNFPESACQRSLQTQLYQSKGFKRQMFPHVTELHRFHIRLDWSGFVQVHAYSPAGLNLHFLRPACRASRHGKKGCVVFLHGGERTVRETQNLRGPSTCSCALGERASESQSNFHWIFVFACFSILLKIEVVSQMLCVHCTGGFLGGAPSQFYPYAKDGSGS